MFTRLGTNTIFFATMILVGFGLVGCGSEGGSGGTGGAGGTDGCGPGETCGIPLGNFPPISAAQPTPCAAPYIPACGTWQQQACVWDVQANECWTTAWCEPSVPSTGENNVGVLNGSPKRVRPVSAKCGSGVTTYTYVPGTLMMIGIDFTHEGYTCIVNTMETTINC